jgi:hypothetical protein
MFVQQHMSACYATGNVRCARKLKEQLFQDDIFHRTALSNTAPTPDISLIVSLHQPASSPHQPSSGLALRSPTHCAIAVPPICDCTRVPSYKNACKPPFETRWGSARSTALFHRAERCTVPEGSAFSAPAPLQEGTQAIHQPHLSRTALNPAQQIRPSYLALAAIILHSKSCM